MNNPPRFPPSELDYSSSPRGEAEEYAEHVLRVAWLRAAAFACFDLENDLGDELPAVFGGGGFGMIAAALLDHAQAIQVLSGYPGREALGIFPACEGDA